jgi:hypothetical protein
MHGKTTLKKTSEAVFHNLICLKFTFAPEQRAAVALPSYALYCPYIARVGKI